MNNLDYVYAIIDRVDEADGFLNGMKRGEIIVLRKRPIDGASESIIWVLIRACL